MAPTTSKAKKGKDKAGGGAPRDQVCKCGKAFTKYGIGPHRARCEENRKVEQDAIEGVNEVQDRKAMKRARGAYPPYLRLMYTHSIVKCSTFTDSTSRTRSVDVRFAPS